MVRTLPSDDTPRLDFQRILAISFAIAVHALAFLVLLVPLVQSPVETARPTSEPERWKITEVPPPPPLPPQLVQPPQPQPRTLPRIEPVATPEPRMAPVEAVIDFGTLAIDPAPTAGTPGGLAPAGDGQPLQGAELRYAVAPPPPYPRDAIRTGAEGVVLLRILVDVDGRPLEVAVERGSGHRSLDREAVRHVQQRWRFEPAMRDGRAVQAWGLVPISFTLQ
ncbi:energy transducer TonB [Pseudoxanthomonas sp. J35]|uniref:energy transducer TonB n=1 Tax=Pseudoxanthomonas sp. J35 TaxID=935852 RepID=UPI00049159BF|nr:energy transducer TonB [Pseudoxanthomonas sp. J35]